MAIFDVFRRNNRDIDSINEEDNSTLVEDTSIIRERIIETTITEDKRSDIERNMLGDIESIRSISPINEGTLSYSPSSLSSILTDGENSTITQLLGTMFTDMGLNEIFQENEEMARDSLVGSAMEIISDDACQKDEKYNAVVYVESADTDLKKFLEDFLRDNIDIENRIWTWTFEVVKHGDFKLRRREYFAGNDRKLKNVYYEDVLNPYSVSRIEYMGNVLGYEDADSSFNTSVIHGNAGVASSTSMSAKFESSDKFVHFMNSKLSKRIRADIRVKNPETEDTEVVTCFKVVGTSIVDNARHIFRVMSMLDNMLILSRIARSTQYNLVKIEVGNASPVKTQQMLSDTRRRLEGATKLKKNHGMRTDPSPIPVNSNIYLPTRDGKGDVTIESVGDMVDVGSIVDIDYFRDKLFAALKIPKQYMGFDESMGALGNNSLVKMDIRYARSVQRVQNIMINGITNLCNNYLKFRGKNSDIGKFKIRVRPLSTSETSNRIEEFSTAMQTFDSASSMLDTYKDYVDLAKFFIMILNLIGVSPNEIASEKLLKIMKEISDGTYEEKNHKEKKDSSDEEW